MRRSFTSGDLCECADTACHSNPHDVEAQILATSILFRVDMDDEYGVEFCNHCANDALESGVFTTFDEPETIPDEWAPCGICGRKFFHADDCADVAEFVVGGVSL